jgi:predicted metal-dependent enzyme (double-stranded beta helix superfamily)
LEAAMGSNVYHMRDFVEDVREIIGRRLDEQATIEHISEPLSRIIARPDCLSDVEKSGNPNPDAGFTICQQDDLTILAVVWSEGSSAPVHNHNGWAMEGVISGKERNRNYMRTDDGSTPWRATLQEVAPSEVAAGQTTSLMLPPNDIHAVEIPEGKTLAIHVYGMDLLKQWRYRFDLATGEVTPFAMRTPRTTPAVK